jgi:hypothetical protein
MRPEVGVRELLVGDGAVGALVGPNVYQLRLPQKVTLPAIRVQLVDEPSAYHLRGTDNLRRSRVQVDAFAAEASGTDPYAGAVAVADAIDAVLSGFRGELGGSPPSLFFDAVFRISRMPMYDADELREVRLMQDYFVWWKAAMT